MSTITIIASTPQPPAPAPGRQGGGPVGADDRAEHDLAGVALISEHGARLALSRLDADCFHDPSAWAVIETAAATTDPTPYATPGTPIDRRIRLVADRVGLFEATLRTWVAEAPCMWDTGGYLARRVLGAAEARRAALEHIEALEALGYEVRWPAGAGTDTS